MPELLPFMVTFCAWVGGGIVSVVTGFGCGLFAMPIMLLCVPTETAIPVTCVLCCVSMLLILIKFWKNIDWRHFLWLSIAALPGVFLGVYTLKTTPIQWIELGFGAFLILSAGWEMARKYITNTSRPIQSLPLELFLALVAGFINGILGMGGPAMALYATLARWDKDMTRGTFGIFFGINLSIGVLLLYQSNLLNTPELDLIIWAVPGAILGTLMGIPLAGRIRQEAFMKLLLLVIIASGIVLIGKGMH